MQSAIATAADYADAIFTARKARNILVLLLLLALLGQIGIFLAARYKMDLQTPTQGVARNGTDLMKYFVGLAVFVGVTAPIVLGTLLAMLTGIMLVGRLVGVSRMISAFLWCVVLAVLLFPWQAFLVNQNFTSAEWKVPGVLYNWPELVLKARMHPESWQQQLLFWGRFIVWPVVAILVLLTIQGKSGRGLRLALGEADVPRVTNDPAASV